MLNVLTIRCTLETCTRCFLCYINYLISYVFEFNSKYMLYIYFIKNRFSVMWHYACSILWIVDDMHVVVRRVWCVCLHLPDMWHNAC